MASDNPNDDPKPVLDYGRPGLDLVPDWNEPAEALIEAVCRPEALLPLFDTPDIAAAYMGKSLARRHSLADCTGNCIGCHRPSDEFAVAVGWRITIQPGPPPLHPGRASFEFERIRVSADFITFHPICVSCYRAWKMRTRTNVIWVMSLGILITLGIASYGLWNWDRHLDKWAAGLFLSLALTAYLTGLALQQFVWRNLPGAPERRVHWAARHNGEMQLVRRVGT